MRKILLKSGRGSDDPTKSAFAFLYSNAFAEAGHEPLIFVLQEPVSIMRQQVADAIVRVGWRLYYCQYITAARSGGLQQL
jgi:hypothetical protein